MNKRIRFFDPGRGYLKIKAEIDSEMQRVLTAGDLILREDVEKFEESLAKYVGAKYAVGLNSGTDALYLSLKALKLEGKRVALPSHTFKATCRAVVNSGAIPVLYDMDGVLESRHVDAHIPVHIAGELSPISDLGIPVIEDACQSLGALTNPISNVQCWSFYPAKILGAYGDAGAITTNDFQIYDYIKGARDQFKIDNRDFGGNYRMDNLQACILNVKFKYLLEFLTKRFNIAQMYFGGLRNIDMPSNKLG